MKIKFILLVFIILIVFSNLFSQTINSKKDFEYSPSSKQKDSLLQIIPIKDDKVLYESVIIADSSIKKEQLFIKIKQWFVDKFMDSKSVLETVDKENGIFSGKGTFKYNKINGLNSHIGYTQFTINVIVKDGKFKYQLYNFHAYGTNTSLWATNPNTSYMKEDINLDEMANWYNSGKRKQYAKKYLEDMVGLYYYIDKYLNQLSHDKTSITDF